jgi:hypothetical protein
MFSQNGALIYRSSARAVPSLSSTALPCALSDVAPSPRRQPKTSQRFLLMQVLGSINHCPASPHHHQHQRHHQSQRLPITSITADAHASAAAAAREVRLQRLSPDEPGRACSRRASYSATRHSCRRLRCNGCLAKHLAAVSDSVVVAAEVAHVVALPVHLHRSI